MSLHHEQPHGGVLTTVVDTTKRPLGLRQGDDNNVDLPPPPTSIGSVSGKSMTADRQIDDKPHGN